MTNNSYTTIIIYLYSLELQQQSPKKTSYFKEVRIVLDTNHRKKLPPTS